MIMEIILNFAGCETELAASNSQVLLGFRVAWSGQVWRQKSKLRIEAAEGGYPPAANFMTVPSRSRIGPGVARLCGRDGSVPPEAGSSGDASKGQVLPVRGVARSGQVWPIVLRVGGLPKQPSQ